MTKSPKELAEVVRVLAHSAHNVLLGRSLVPLDRLERESLKSLSDVSDRTLLSVDVLCLRAYAAGR